MKKIIVFLLHLAGGTGLKILISIFVGLALWGGSIGPFIWLPVLLILGGITAEGILRLRARPVWPGECSIESEFRDGSKLAPFELIYPTEEENRDTILKVLGWWLALPSLIFAAWAWSEPVVDWYSTLRVPAIAFVGIGMVALALPDLWKSTTLPVRTVVRFGIALSFLIFAAGSVYLRHPYLISGYPNAHRLKAERILSTGNIVAIQRHAGVLAECAADFETGGEIDKARTLLNLAARADNTNSEILLQFADFLQRHGKPGEDTAYREIAARADSPIISDEFSSPYDFSATKVLKSFFPNTSTRHRLVLIADRNVPVELLDKIGSVIADELEVEVLRLNQPIGIHGETRRSGILSSQISIEEAWKEVASQLPRGLRPPDQLLVITSRDLFAPGANYLYGSPAILGGGIVSYARLGNAKEPASDEKLLDSLCKQSLSTVLKSLIIYPSPDSRDVTAYVNGPFQQSRKGRRPMPATLFAYRESIKAWENSFKKHPPVLGN